MQAGKQTAGMQRGGATRSPFDAYYSLRTVATTEYSTNNTTYLSNLAPSADNTVRVSIRSAECMLHR
jgi:hypothetical protein